MLEHLGLRSLFSLVTRNIYNCSVHQRTQEIMVQGILAAHWLRTPELGLENVAGLCAGFSLHDGRATQAKKFFQLGPGSGRQDLRGQHSAARSLGGLVFQN